LSFTTSIATGANDIVLGPNGTTLYWTANGTQIGSYDDATGYGGNVTIPGARFLGKMAVGADGFLYAADSDPNAGGRSNQIWRIDPVTWTGTALTTPTPNSLPWGITSGADGNIWFTESWSRLDGSASSNKVGMIDVAGGTYAVTEFATPRTNSLPEGIIPGPTLTDPDSVWFIEYNTGYFGRIDLATHAITEFFAGDTTSNSLGGQSGLGLATDDINLFFSEYAAVGGFDPVTQRNFGNFTTPQRHDPEGMTLAADGQLYLTERNDGELLRFDPDALQFTGEAPVPAYSDPFLLTAGPGAPSGYADVWLTNPLVHRVDRYEIDGMPLVAGRGGFFRHAVPLTPADSSAPWERIPGDSPSQSRVDPGVHRLLTSLQEVARIGETTSQPPSSVVGERAAGETVAPLSADSAARHATDAVFASSHRLHTPVPWGTWQVEGLESGLS
jgi:streptogramin lyase